MNLAAPNLDTARFELAMRSLARPLTSPYTGATELYRPGFGRWHGVVEFVAASPDWAVYETKARLAAQFHLLLQGLDNVVTLPLPEQYRADLPGGTDVAVGTITTSAAGLVVPLTLTHNDGADLAVGDFVNLGDRLYQIVAQTGSNRTLRPSIAPASATPTAEVKNPFIKAMLDAEQPFGQVGLFMPGRAYPFVEAV